ncbi:MAG: M20/M25/M40 family metallo-hydrolase [Bacteroidales bacterium]|nr:M20/M25/M40 family metallo-hydrolase [Bacteroidales bacterium]
MRKGSKKFITLLAAIACSVLILAQDADEQLVLKHFHSISSEEIAGWMTEICAPEFNGRLAGTPEYLASAEWVAGKLREWGIKPAGDDGSFYQWFDHPYTVVNDIGALRLHFTQKDGSVIIKSYSAPVDYYPGMNSGNGEVTAEVVFVGYGVTAPELNYDDYNGIDVRGKIVMMNRDVHYKDVRNPEYAKWVRYCYHQYKAENAAAHGAAGMLYIDGNSANPNISYVENMIVCGIGPEPLADIFAGLDKDNKSLMEQMDKTFKPASFATGKTMTVKANTTRHPEGRTCNVVGMLEGTDPVLKDEVIIIGGHLDAVGNAGGLLVDGGLDNASGVIDILAAAKALAESGIKMKRTVLFLLIGGEEVGLLGSKYYTSNPIFPKEKTVTYINLDMVGNGTGLAVSASATCAGLTGYFKTANDRYIHRPMRVSTSGGMFYGRPRSDGLVFLADGFRTMGLSTTDGVKPVYYHLPGDDETAVTPEIMEDVAKLIYLSFIEIANADILNY